MNTKTISKRIQTNYFSKDKLSITFIGYFYLHRRKEQLIKNNINPNEWYKEISNISDISFENMKTFIKEVDIDLDNIKKEYGEDTYKSVLDKWNILGLKELKRNTNKTLFLDKFITTLDNEKELEVSDLIDLFEYLNVSDKYFNDFFTPNSLTQLVGKIVKENDFDNKDTINLYDPSVGIGRLLYHSFIELRGKYPNKTINVFGIDLCERFSIFTESIFNLINFNNTFILNDDTLETDKYLPHMDIIVSNPPYDKKKIELKFIEHIESLGSKSYVILPMGFTHGEKEESTRKRLMDNNLLKTIIQLPSNLFLNTNIQTCLIEIDDNPLKKFEKHLIQTKQDFNIVSRKDGLDSMIKSIKDLEEQAKEQAKKDNPFKDMSLIKLKNESEILMTSLLTGKTPDEIRKNVKDGEIFDAKEYIKSNY